MILKMRDRNGKYIFGKESNSVRFLYGTVVGRIFAKFFSLPVFSKLVGWFLSTSLSSFLIKSFVKKNKIDLGLYENRKYNSFNDFFTRKLKSQNISVVYDESVFVSPCDSKLLCFKIGENSEFKIKDSFYSILDLLNGNCIYRNYIGGYIMIFRLCADDYHRYIYIDNGVKEENIFVKGKLNTVRPIALEHINIFKKNSREYSVLHTENFGDIVQIEVGAVLVGKISNFHETYKFKRGEEKGMFEFGGSTIVLLVQKNIVEIDEDILENSKDNVETLVKLGEKIGKKSVKR